MSWAAPDNRGGVRLIVRVVPRASRDAVAGVVGDALKIRLQAPPVEGKANAALTRFLAKTLGIPARDVQIVSGETSRNKHIRLVGIDLATTTSRLAPDA